MSKHSGTNGKFHLGYPTFQQGDIELFPVLPPQLQFYLLLQNELSGLGAEVKTEVGEEPVRATCSSGAGSEEDGREAGLLCVGGGMRLKKEWQTVQDRVNGPWEISPTGGAIDCEPLTGC